MPLKQLEPGDQFSGSFLLRTLTPREARNGATFWDLELYDKSGRLQCRWFQPPTLLPTPIPLPVHAEGFVEEFNGKKVGKISVLVPLPEEKIIWEDLLPSSKRPFPELINDLKTRVAAIQDEWYKKLWELLLADESWFSKYCEAPAGKLWHHMYRGGLLEHSLCIADHCDLAAQHHELCDRDLLLSGALLHDVGKVWELSPLPSGDYTESGRLLGHIFMGTNFVSRKMETIEGFPTRHKVRLLHLLLSHQGTREKGSPIIPATLEAIILHHSDELDAHAEAYEHIIEAQTGSERIFTDYVPLAGAHLYLGDRTRPDSPTSEEKVERDNLDAEYAV
ncbi:MAG: HD domain-containing protein [bacterium]|nr:HD domain-containing protein [bacterium]